ncbi:unnamed protein product [Spirodela intermedia]|uniref:AB hydrolase-1 domain-containing protein n=1 Tax=Spirodela intermedia TaxID=51605 RepID=A0A7I8IP11_SPIIN|nr:unnamed protein product [Spirodela intermedia]CAA6659323.1 unnamed protein product [Spirodela intermedia]
MAPWFSVISLFESLVRRSYTAAGLREETHEIDGGETTMRCWVSPDVKDGRPTVVGPLSRRLRLVIPDLLFFGGSATRSPNRSEVFQAQCVLKLLDLLGVFQFSAVGNSYGGFVGFHLVKAAGAQRVDRLVLASSDPLKSPEDDAALLERAGMRSIPDLILPRSTQSLRAVIHFAMYRKPLFMPNFLLSDVLRSLFTENAEEKLALINGLELDKDGEISSPLWSREKSCSLWIDAPWKFLFQQVLLIWGDHDRLFPLETAHRLKDHLGEGARLEVIKNTGHAPQTEDPGRFNELVLAFLLEAR